jgi:hypothetical protein
MRYFFFLAVTKALLAAGIGPADNGDSIDTSAVPVAVMPCGLF